MTAGKTKTPKNVAVALNASCEITVSPEIVWNVLRQAGLKARKKVKKASSSDPTSKIKVIIRNKLEGMNSWRLE